MVSPTQVVVDLKKNLVIDLRGGNDSVDGTDLKIPGSLQIKDKIGNNSFNFNGCEVEKSLQASLPSPGQTVVNAQDLKVGGQVAIVTGAGDDRIDLGKCEVGGSTSIKCGPGNDHVHADGGNFVGGLNGSLEAGNDMWQASGNHVGGAFDLNAGPGNDTLDIFGLSQGSKPAGGPAKLTRCTINLGKDEPTASNQLDLGNLFMDIGQAQVIGGGGNDVIDLNTIFNVRRLVVNTGSGNDLLGLDNFSGDQVNFITGSGNDQCTIEHAGVRGPCAVNLGPGDDTLGVGSSTLGYRSPAKPAAPVFNGGPGDDAFSDLGGNNFADLPNSFSF